MAAFLLDTHVLIDFSSSRQPTHSRLSELLSGNDAIAVCPVNVAEFYTGLAPLNRQAWDQFFETIPCWPISRAAARQAGIWRHDFARQGITLDTPETLVAAVAHERGATLVTESTRHFPMPELSLMSFR